MGYKWTDRVVGDDGQPKVKVRRSRSLSGWQVIEKGTKTTNGKRDMFLIPEADQLWNDLRARLTVIGMDAYVFSVDGVAIHPQKVSKRFAELQEIFRADHPEVRRLTFYGTRHCGITLALKAGVPLYIVSKAAGHSSMAFTADAYAEVLPTDLSDAAALMSRRLGGAQV